MLNEKPPEVAAALDVPEAAPKPPKAGVDDVAGALEDGAAVLVEG